MRRAAGFFALTLAVLAGCNCVGRPDVPKELPSEGVVDLSSMSYEQVAQAMNERAERLERFWAATITTVWYIGKQGEDEVDQLDGDLHIVQPNKIALTLEKIGVDGAALGANERFYWFVDLLADDPIASIGTHSKANPDQLADLGVPVHPLDLLLLLGFSKVPERPINPERPLRTTASGGHVVLAAPATWGIVEYTLDPETFEPVRVEIRRGPRQPPVLTADMVGTIPFDDRLDRDKPPVRIPERVVIDVPEIDARVRIRLLGAQSSRRKPDERAFDLGDTLSRYGVRLRRDLDAVHERLRTEDP